MEYMNVVKDINIIEIYCTTMQLFSMKKANIFS